jgi:hypothetical protein
MPTYTLTSAKTGQSYDVDFANDPVEDDVDEVLGSLDRDYAAANGVTLNELNQGGSESGLKSAAKSLVQFPMQAVGGLSKALGAATDWVANLTGTQKGGLFDDVAGFTDESVSAAEQLLPTNPANKVANTIGSGVGQIIPMIGSAGMGAVVGGAGTAAKVPVVLGGAAALGQGIDTAEEIGIQDPLGKLAVGAAFAVPEMAIEKLGGIGAKTVMEPVKQSIGGVLRSGLSEVVEEPLTGAAQELVTNTAAELAGTVDPKRPGYAITGAALPGAEGYWERRGLEALGGLAGGAVVASMNHGKGSATPEKPAEQNADPAPVQPGDGGSILDQVAERQAAASTRGVPGSIVVETEAPTPAQTAPDNSFVITDDGQLLQAPTVPPPQQVPLGSPEAADMLPSVPASESAPTPGADPRLQPATEGQPVPSSPPIASPAMPQSGPAGSATTPTTAEVPPPTQQAPGQPSQETAESRPRVRMAEKILTTQGVDGETAAMLAVQMEATLPTDLPAEQYRERVLQETQVAGFRLPSDLTRFSENPVEYEAAGYSAAETAQYVADAVAHNAQQRAEMDAHNKGLAQRMAKPSGMQNFRIPLNNNGGFVDSQVLVDAAQAAWQKGLDFVQWSKEMIRKFGEAVRSYLADAWSAAKKTSQMGAVNINALNQPNRPRPTLGPDQDTRTFGGRVRDDPRISSGTQTTMGMDAVYDIARNADTFAAANALIDQQGLAAAEQILYDESNGLPGHVRVTLGQQLIMRMDKAARTNPDAAQRKALRDAAAKVLDYTDRKGTEAGQTVQAFAMWARMSPEGVMMHYDRKLKEANGGKLPTLPPELLDKLGELRDQINALPGDSITRAEKMHELLTELARFDGVPIGSLFASIWYANLLSGLTTQGINVWGNGLHLAMRNMAAAFVSHPSDTARMLGATMRGLAKGYADAKAALRGKHIMKGSVKYDTPSTSDYARNNAMEIALGKPPSDLKSWAAWIGSVGGLTKYVFRSLQVADAIFWHTAAEGRASLAASRAARANHKPGSPEYFQYISDALGTSQAAFVGALDQAANEMKAAGMPVDLNLQNRRAWELLERSRPREVNEEAHRFADMATFNEDPRGVGKWIYDVIQSLQGVQVAGVQPLRALLPFARIPANLVSLGLDFTPVGALRAAVGHHITDKKAEPFSTPERLEKLAASVMGTIAGAIVYQVASQFAGEDDESAPFMLYGSGRGSKEKNATMPPGWKPFSIKVGDKYVSYAETPMGLVLAPLGALMDSNRYKTGLNEQSWAMRAEYLARTMAGTVFSQGVLSSAADVMDVMGGKTPLAKLPSRFTSGMIPMSGMMRDITPLFDPVKISDDTVMAAILRDVPVVRNLYGKPALNIFGEPVVAEGLARVPVVKRMVTSQGNHPEANWMARNNLSVPGFDTRLEYGAYLPGPQRKSLQENRASRAAAMSRLSSNIMTAEENYAFTKRAGELTKQAVKRLMTQPPSVTPEQLQDRLDDAVTAARKLSMRELVGKLQG